jgi:hypothetical protein
MNTRAGRVGDLLAAAVVERLGGMPTIVRTDGCDIIANYENRWYRVEVKATGKQIDAWAYQFKLGTGSAKNPLNASDCDILACVALDLRLVYFLPIVEVQQKTKRIAARLFTAAAEESTWVEAINRVG